MADIQWDDEASLMRVTAFATAEASEELVARGTTRELVGEAVAMPAEQQAGLVIRQAGADWTREWDADAIRELAARPEFTGAAGAYDTAERGEDPDRNYAENEETLVDGETGGPSRTDALGQDGEG